ncbi:subtilisin family serine protease [Nitrosomonas nitrosa]|uniref:S8 family serine peptidase n=1 Tax=Nitrosomonas nitrosa TaxID=52442 RepID=UPI000D406C13|nr:S8 family serine peptidase [Nitrosomonas nitrosa]PTQ98829.1 subtilisin family serine protease [Nitrosomonas nitrosa]
MIINKSITPIHHNPSTHPSNPSIRARMNHFFCYTILAGFVSLAPTLSSAAPPEHANERAQAVFSEDTLPENARSKRMDGEEFARGRILIMPRAGLPAQALANILKEHDGKPRKIGQSDLYIVDLPEYTEEGVIARLAHHPHLKFAELDRAVPPSLAPNDPYYPNGWHLPKIGSPVAWDSSQGTGITIAILDSGVDGSHPDLAAKMVPGWNFYNNNSNTADVRGHGTKVAGAAAAITNNGTGVAGIAGQAKIMPIRVADADGYGYDSMIIQGLTYAADKGARVANASYLGLSSSSAVQNAALYMKNKGGLVTVSGGNSGRLESFAATTTMIPVAATDAYDNRTSWSSYGNYIVLAAPGAGIWTTTSDGGYGSVNGTSFSSPITAGVIALMMAANPKMKNTDIEKILFSTAKDLGTLGKDPYFGYGRVDAAAAVKAVKAATTSTTADTEAPKVSILGPLTGEAVSGLVPVDIEVTDNIGVVRTELWVNSTSVAVDTSVPFAFTWDSKGVPNGTANLTVRAIDASGNAAASNTVNVNVSNQTSTVVSASDTSPPTVKIINPVSGSIKGNITITVNAADNSGAANIALAIYIDGILSATGSGSTLSTNWNTRPKSVVAGKHTIKAMAKDKAGNISYATVDVTVIK